MPLMRYFAFVGGALFALLMIVNACLPALPAADGSAASVDRSVIRIQSNQRWPERVVFDTTLPTIIPASAALPVAEVPSPQKATAAAQDRVREAFAQVSPNPGRLEPRRKHKSVAKNPARSSTILVAQQRPVVFFGNTIW